MHTPAQAGYSQLTTAPHNEFRHFTTLTPRALHAAIRYHRLRAEALSKRISEEMRRIENTDTTESDDREFRRLISDHIEHTEMFTAALRESRARKKSTT